MDNACAVTEMSQTPRHHKGRYTKYHMQDFSPFGRMGGASYLVPLYTYPPIEQKPNPRTHRKDLGIP